jgi:23S rRNA (cytosine1962-C5)-methyltransferase
MAALPKLTLPERLEASLLGGHPWVYREHVAPSFVAAHGSFVRLRCGRFDGIALWDQDSALALRIYSRGEVPGSAWYEQRLRDAWALRAPLLDQQTNALRWVHGEADALPGIVIDYYAGYAVIALDSSACEGIAKELATILHKVHPVLGVLQRKRHAAGDERLVSLLGDPAPETLIVTENGLKLKVDLNAGQKTGLFLDQRENRALIGERARGLRVLNLFAYSGAFSLYALRGGAAQAIDVDLAPQAGDDARENVRLNGFDPARHQFIVADVFEYLEQARVARETHDLVICDPPTFGRNKAHLDKALNAYARVNAAGMKLCGPGALYAAASCTSRVTPQAFKQALADAARRAQRRLQLVQERGQALDHPELVSHPESRYLKFVLGRALPRI